MKKIILINIVVFLIIIASAMLTLSLSFDFYRFIVSKGFFQKIDKRVEIPVYQNLDWPKIYFMEEKSLKSSYYDFIGWRRNDFKGETVNIEDGYRLNKSQEKFNLKKDIWVFGGSTIWGSGVRDHETIPAYMEEISKISTLNLGEFGYTSTQELNLLIKNIILHKPKIILFYDGFNDVFHKCRKENNYYSGAREKFIQEKIKDDQYIQSYTLKFFEPVKKLVEKLILKDSEKLYFNCDINLKKSERIAKILVNNWMIASSIADKYNIKFIPILQPVAYFTNSLTDHISLENRIKAQFEVVYPIILNELNKKNISFVNLADSLNEKKYFYIDHVHLSPTGNRKIANDIIKNITTNN